ncbi:MAG: DNA polymerase III subunit delta' [Lachnospiraceae bacterium]|nr:DNA polymerase III subunit delta' [Lachnospiraceae bacterium]
MYKFTDIVGQEQIKEHLQTAIRTEKISHAYILSGEKHSGKEFIARVFAAALQCEKHGTEPCGECHSCRQAMTDNHPDIKYVLHDKPNTVGIDDIRTQINNDVIIRPYSSERKIYILNEAEKMNTQAQNALLKTLEEPPEYATIILLTSNVNAFLPTILSRCIKLDMKPVADEKIKNYLMRTIQIPDYRADICVAFARGNVGRAKHLAQSEDFEAIQNDALGLVKNIRDMELYEIVAAVKGIAQYKVEIADYLDIIAIWYRDALIYKATADANSLIFRNEVTALRRVADRSTYEGIEEIIRALESAKRRIEANVNLELVMELLLMTIKERG